MARPILEPNMKAIVVVIVLTMVTAATAEEGGTVVDTDKGRVEGLVEETLKGRSFFAFYGIPFAKPPLGDLRFKDPEPSTYWMRVWKSTKMPPPCLQVPLTSASVGVRLTPEDLVGSENCLYLNVFTPSVKLVPIDERLPVMVWVHGGAFFSGGAHEYLPHALLEHDIVLVVVQYRLGVLGFLSTEDAVMPGNLGLKDQTLALHWVQNNIHNFGGDKTRVTIFGQSAGGASVHYQMLAPSAKGLFSRVIMQSGTGVAPWVFHSTSSTMQEGVEVVRQAASCPPHQDSLDLLACLQKADARELAVKVQDLFKWYVFPFVPRPRVDGEYLPDHPMKMVREGRYHQVDLMIGVMKHDGVIIAHPLMAQPSLMASLVSNFSSCGPVSLSLDEEEDSVSLSKRFYEHYLGGLNFDEDHAEEMIELYSNVYFMFPLDVVLQNHVSHAKDKHATFHYQLEHRGELSMSGRFNNEIVKNCVAHGDDLNYLFTGGPMLQPTPTSPLLSDPEDLLLRDIITKMWTNFAAKGQPTPDASLGFTWEAATPDRLHHLALTPAPTMKPDARHQMREFHASLSTRFSAGLPAPATRLHQEQSRAADEL